jgi:DNA-binding MarR family transcriptional regulator
VNSPTEISADPLEPQASLTEAEITLGMLNAVEGNSVLTQRSLARELGIALGLANAYLKRCVGKGLIKVSHIPAKRYAYYLTPKGFSEKSRLTAQYLAHSFDFFRVARMQCDAVFADCAAQGWRWVVLCGAGDLAEIAALCASGHAVTILGIVDPAGGSSALPVKRSLAEFEGVEAAIVTDYRQAQATYDRMVVIMPPDRVLTPRILNISRVRPTLAE